MSHSSTEPWPPAGTDPDVSTSSGDTKETAVEQAGAVKDTAADAGRQVAGTAKDQAQNVAQEAASQGKALVGQAGDQLSGQASSAQRSLAATVRSYAEELGSMSSSSDGSGAVSGLARQASDRGHTIADWLEHREPRELLTEVQRFARQRPGAFLGIAAVTGVLVGRLTRNLAAEHHDQKTASADAPTPGPRYAPAPAPSASLAELPDDAAGGADAVYDQYADTPVAAPPYQGGAVTGGTR